VVLLTIGFLLALELIVQPELLETAAGHQQTRAIPRGVVLEPS